MINRLFGIVILSLVLFSCSKEEEAATSSGAGFTATVDDTPWAASDVVVSVYNGTIVLIGEDAEGRAITFSIDGDSVGAYPVNSTTASSASYIAGKGAGQQFSSAGSLSAGGEVSIESISVSDKKISGSLFFDAVRSSDDSTIVIENGKFTNITYVTVPINTGNSTLSAKVNGSNWNPDNTTGTLLFNQLVINANTSGSARTLTFELPQDIPPGSYELNYFTDYKAVYIDNTGVKFYAESGTLEIEKHHIVTREIEGKFEIKTEAHEGGGSANITSGSFSVIYE